MRVRRRLSLDVPSIAPFALVIACWVMTTPSVAPAQSARGTPEAGEPTRPALPRTPWGDPDIQGTWPGGPLMSVPFERAPELGTRVTLTAEEVAKRNADIDAQL